MSATAIPDMQPGSPEWLKVMSASKIAAVVGLSPWTSRYALWHLMCGDLPPEVELDEHRRGHYLEPAICGWWEDQQTEAYSCQLKVRQGRTWRNDDRPWQVATPDRELLDRHGDVREILEAKSDNDGWAWGEELTDAIPVYYACQVQYQLDTLDLDLAHVAVLTGGLNFRRYIVRRDEDDIAFLREAAVEFLASIDAGDEPDVDESEHTYSAVRRLHPDLEDTELELTAEQAAEWIAALRAKESGEAAYNRARSRLTQAMGRSRRAVYGGQTYATRSARDGGTPYITAARGLTRKDTAA